MSIFYRYSYNWSPRCTFSNINTLIGSINKKIQLVATCNTKRGCEIQVSNCKSTEIAPLLNAGARSALARRLADESSDATTVPLTTPAAREAELLQKWWPQTESSPSFPVGEGVVSRGSYDRGDLFPAFVQYTLCRLLLMASLWVRNTLLNFVVSFGR